MATRGTTSTRGPPSSDRCCELRCVVLPVPLLRLGGTSLSSVLGNPEDLEPMLELLLQVDVIDISHGVRFCGED